MTSDLANLMGAGLAMFLIGANGAFLVELGSRIVPWFRIKISAMLLVFLYIALSLTYGNPDAWRVVIGDLAMLVDVFALVWMWHSIIVMERAGIVGLVPLILTQRDPNGADD